MRCKNLKKYIFFSTNLFSYFYITFLKFIHQQIIKLIIQKSRKKAKMRKTFALKNYWFKSGAPYRAYKKFKTS